MADVVPTPVYFAWITSSDIAYAEALVAKLVRRGFTVAPLGRQLITQHDENAACVVAFSVQRVPRDDAEQKEYTVAGIHGEICDVIKQVKGKYWSLVVSLGVRSTWNIGNCRCTEEEAQEALAKRLN